MLISEGGPEYLSNTSFHMYKCVFLHVSVCRCYMSNVCCAYAMLLQIHALRAPTEVRVALLNKDIEKSCNLDLVLEDKFCTKNAVLSWLLPGPQGMMSKGGITWQGQHYLDAGTTGKLGGVRQVMPVPLRRFGDGRCGYTVAMPAATGALLVLKTTGQAAGQ